MPATLSDLARALNLDRSTVSRALNNHPRTSEATKARVREAAEKMGYSPDVAASLLSTRRWRRAPAAAGTGLAAIVRAAQREDGSLRASIEGFKQRAGEIGYRPEVVIVDERLLSTMNAVWNRGVQGILLFLDVWDDFPIEFPWNRFTVLVVNSRNDWHPFSAVRENSFERILLCMRELVARNYERIGAILWDEAGSDIDVATIAALTFFQERAIAPSNRVPPLLMNAETAQRNRRVNPNGELDPSPEINAWLDQWRPDVVIGMNDLAQWWLRASGRRIPQDIGFLDFESERNPDRAMIGRVACDQIDLLLRSSQSGVPPARTVTLIDPMWVETPTIRPRSPGAETTLLELRNLSHHRNR